jgi:hypothetical protein
VFYDGTRVLGGGWIARAPLIDEPLPAQDAPALAGA